MCSMSNQANNTALQMTSVTGQDCPRSGTWQALATALPPISVRQGDIMPGANGRVVTWELVQPETPGQGISSKSGHS
jgi:hypothetical protein